ncbi:MAG: hypothetical protein LEGION0403_FIIPPAGN_02055 [Legionella sp.]|uniref:hypothetical protein n=1 Tax=Legionella sp. TaxID=459 RepID=UPI003D0FBF59
MLDRARNIKSFLGHLVSKIEPEYTLRLEDIIYSKKHGHEVCVMQLVGKNAFPQYTTEELLSDPNALKGINPLDAIEITKLHYTIKERKRKLKVLEVDRNGTIVLRDSSGKEQRYSERQLSSSRELIKEMMSEDAHDLGYRVGFKDGLFARKTIKEKKTVKAKILDLIKFR